MFYYFLTYDMHVEVTVIMEPQTDQSPIPAGDTLFNQYLW